MSNIEHEAEMRERQKQYLDFLDDDNDHGLYSGAVKDMIKREDVRLVVNINDLRKKNPVRTLSLMNNAFEEMAAFERAFRDLIGSVNPEYLRKKENFFIGLEGSFGARHVTPRSLSSRFLGQIVCLEGIVTKCSLVRPKVVKSVHYCPATKKFTERGYSDSTSYEGATSSSVYPTKDDEGNLLETEFGLSIYKDHQTFTIQEMPEKAPAGQLPRSVDVIADNDLVDLCKPGDRVQVVGSFRCLPAKQGVYTSGTFRCVLLANNLRLLSKEVLPNLTTEDVRRCRKFSQQKGVDVFALLARSLAPSIHGHEYIKKALLCMLLGGVEKILQNGTRLRGDINIMLIGDPSTAKSQLLRYVLCSAPRAIPTTGRGSSGVGLTAAVTSDPETGERRLEAGAMVLADRGVVCIDEFDKMSDMDRTAIHEVMEQGRVTITKAGINARLNARCSVLAAANPVYGRYDEYKSPMENIGMQDSLLSRFDLLFIILDKHERTTDGQIADHVVRVHQYRSPNEQDGEPLPIISSADFLTTKDLENEDDDNETPMYEQYNNLLHGNRSKSDKIVSVKFMKKYIHIAKSMKPDLTDEANELIAESYANIRQFEQQEEDMARTQPITVRALETMIRLATAHAKGRMSRKVEIEDALAAIELVQFAYFKRIIEKPKKRGKKVNESGDEESGSDDDEDEDMDGDKEVIPKRKSRRSAPADDDQAMDVDDNESGKETQSSQRSTTITVESAEMPADKFKKFKSLLNVMFQKVLTEKLLLQDIYDRIMEQDRTMDQAGIDWALAQMQNENQVMVADGDVYLI